MSAAQPYFVSDEDDVTSNDSDGGLELLDYDSDGSEPEITGVFTRESSASGRSVTPLKNGTIQAPDAEIQRFRLNKGCYITPGSTVELKDSSAHEGDAMHSGDFFRIQHIIINLETDKVRLRGYCMRRTKYLKQMFDWKLNELAMVLHVKESDTRCPFVAGMEDVSVDKVLRPRDCVLTNKPYPFHSFRDVNSCSFPPGLTEKQIKEQVFHGGRLVCRLVNIRFISKNGKPYSGIVRFLYGRESDTTAPMTPNDGPGLSRSTPIPIEEEDQSNGSVSSHGLAGLGKRRARSNSLEVLEQAPTKRKSPHPTKRTQYTFGDVFCGAGGASQGAKQAGLVIIWGLDNDSAAIEAYGLNHTGALRFRRNAHNFPPRGYTNEELRVDILHLSPPCCFFSPAHTREGPNDQANLEAIYTVGPILKKVKPRVATLEQTFGLLTHEQHNANFLMLLNDIGSAGYDMRYKVQDLSQHGLVQQRKRLLIIAARRGTPLPPFPKITHGPAGSGLKKFNYIHDALLPIQRLADRPSRDPYHIPKPAKDPRPPYNAHSFLKSCITTSGPDSYHPSGLRRFTPRELSLFQSFPYGYKFTGGVGEATKQIGNAFPPIVAEAFYRVITKTLEAFDSGHIEAEDDLMDLDGILERKGVEFNTTPTFGRSMFSAPQRYSSQPSRYLQRDNNNSRSTATSTFQSSPLARNQAPTPERPRSRKASSFEPMGLLDGLLSDGDEEDVRPSIEAGSRRPSSGTAVEDAIEVSSESEEESDD